MTYDDRRAGAVLRICQKCGSWWFTQQPDPFICRDCARTS